MPTKTTISGLILTREFYRPPMTINVVTFTQVLSWAIESEDGFDYL